MPGENEAMKSCCGIPVFSNPTAAGLRGLVAMETGYTKRSRMSADSADGKDGRLLALLEIFRGTGWIIFIELS